MKTALIPSKSSKRGVARHGNSLDASTSMTKKFAHMTFSAMGPLLRTIASVATE